MFLAKFLLVLVGLIAISVSGAHAYYHCLDGADDNGLVCEDLIAGQNILVGQVCVGITDTSITVSVSTESFVWNLDYTHLWVGINLADVPITTTGNPIPGLFPYTCEPTDDETCVFEIEFEDGLPCDDTIWYALHANVSRLLENDGTATETAWGNGDRFVDRGNWGTYSSVYVFCNCEENPCQDPAGCGVGCETAFAQYQPLNTCFLDIDNQPAFNRWGWSNGPLSTALSNPSQTITYDMDIWAGAGQCDTTKGTFVGHLIVVVSADTITVSYNLGAGFSLQETHLYIGTEILQVVQQGRKYVQTVAPGQYPFSHENIDGVSTDTYEIDNVFAGEDIYVVAHGVVCSGDF